MAFHSNDLASIDREQTPWVIIDLHRPWYVAAGNTSSNVCLACQQTFKPLMIKYGAYERNAPIASYSLDPNGLNNQSAPWNTLDTLKALPYCIYGWPRLIFHSRTHLTHEFVTSANGNVMDSATLYKAHDFSSGNGTGNSQ
ncbi:hypothetical protein OG21DRAFT_1598424 [Imleria badia]|nr:hypothetical protein OG21DRAFT_1598424 [Imleria badia]